MERIIQVPDGKIMSEVFGNFDENIKMIEKRFNVSVHNREEIIKISGSEKNSLLAQQSIEALISIAEKENKSNIQRICNLLYGIMDLLSFMLIVLPLYPNPINGYIYSVNLFFYGEVTSFQILFYWILYTALIIVGIAKIFLTKFQIEKGQNIVTNISMGLSTITVLFLSLTREAYAIIIVFILLIIKGILLLKYIKNS